MPSFSPSDGVPGPYPTQRPRLLRGDAPSRAAARDLETDCSSGSGPVGDHRFRGGERRNAYRLERPSMSLKQRRRSRTCLERSRQGGLILLFSNCLRSCQESVSRRTSGNSSTVRCPVASDLAQIPYNEVLRHLATRVPHVSTISVTDLVCPNELCSPEIDGITIRYDGLHFSSAAGGWLAPSLYQRLADAGVITR